MQCLVNNSEPEKSTHNLQLSVSVTSIKRIDNSNSA